MEGRHAPRPRSSPSPYVFGGIIAVVLVVVLATRFLFGGDGRLSQATGGGGGRDCVGVTVASSPDKFPLLRQLAAGYAGTRPTVDGRCVTVTVTSKESAAAVAALARDWSGAADGPRPDVWMPSSTAWVALLQAQRGASHRPNIVPPELPPVATTPLVLAMPRPVAERIGWPRRQPTWSQAYGLALQGWKAAGKPELGEFRMGTSDPFVSTAGLATLVGSGYAAAELVYHRPTPLSMTVLGNELVQRTLLGFDRAVKERAQSSAELLGKLGSADRQDPRSVPRVFSALAVEEKSVLDYNQGNPGGDPSSDGHQPPRVPLVATYPSDGTVLADHPYVVLDVPWVDDAKRVAAGGFLEFLQAPGQQARFQQLGFRNHQGQAGPLATQRNGLLGSRRLSPLQTPEPRVVAALVKGYAQNRRKGNLLTLTDVSGSMRELVPGTRLTRMELANRANLAALPLLSDEGSFGQWIFSTNLDGAKDYRQLVPLGPMGEVLPDGRTRRDTLTALVGTLQPTNGDTGLYDSTWAAVQYMHKQYRADRLNAVVLITDGRNDDPGGGLTLDQLLARLRGQGKQVVHIVAIGYGPEADQAVLQKITAASAGVAIAVRDPRDIQRAFIEALQRF